MRFPFVLLLAVACARPIGPVPPILEHSVEVELLNPFESPLQTPDTPAFESPIVDDDDIDGAIDASFAPDFPESSQFPVFPSSTPSPSPSLSLSPSISTSPSLSPSASISPSPSLSVDASAVPSHTSNTPDPAVSTAPPPLVTPSSTPVNSQNAPSLPPMTPTRPPSQSKPSENRDTSQKGNQVPTAPDKASKNPGTTFPPSSTTGTTTPRPSTSPQISPQISPQLQPQTSTQLSTPLPTTNNPRADDTAAPQQLPAPSPGGPADLPPLPSPVMAQRTTCFPASATVTLIDGSVVRMRDLAIGDFVHVGSGRYSQVHMFTHREYETVQRFVRVMTEAGLALTVSEGHFVYVGALLKPAREISVGDELPLGDGSFTRVESVEPVLERGLFNPQTTVGDIVVNGIKASVYTEAVKPTLAHAALLPLRVAFSLFGVATQCADHGFPESVPRNLRSLVSSR